MENEQEGINLEAVSLENEEGITLSNTTEEVESEELEGTETTEISSEPEKELVVDEEKEALKRGVNRERKARKEAERKYKELEARMAALEEKAQAPTKTTLEELMENGVEESIAKSIAKAIDKKQTNTKKVEQELSDMKFKLELSEKSKDSNFSDIMEYEDEIKELVGKGLTVEQAYHALNYDKEKTINTKSEIERKVEAKLQNNQARKQILGNINSNSGNAINNDNNKPKASSLEVAIAQIAGVDINDYLAVKNSDSIKQYEEYKSKKVK